MNETAAKLLALCIVGGVAKSLFGPAPVYNTYAQAAKDVVENINS